MHGFNDNRRHSAPRSSAERQFRLPTRTTWTIAFYRQVQSTSRCSSLETLNAMRGKPSPELESASPFPATPSAGLCAQSVATTAANLCSRPMIVDGQAQRCSAGDGADGFGGLPWPRHYRQSRRQGAQARNPGLGSSVECELTSFKMSSRRNEDETKFFARQSQPRRGVVKDKRSATRWHIEGTNQRVP